MDAPARLSAELLAALPRDLDAVVVRDGRRCIVAAVPDEVLIADGVEALRGLDHLDADGAEGRAPGWWAGWLSYDLGRSVERVAARTHDDLGVPDVVLGRFGARILVDPGTRPRVVGDGPGREVLDTAVRVVESGSGALPPAPGLRGWTSGIDRGDYEAAVRAVVELIRAGDCYQVNLTRRLTAGEPADPIGLWASLVTHNPAPHAAFCRFSGLSIVSASPERFLRRDGERVETRPIKGTGREAAALSQSAKDRAENVMIVDLARNDLGRVCRYGSLEVPDLCRVEAHPGLLHLVSTVRATVPTGVGTGALIRATFPPASVTGAPKPRVMQAIEDLEPVRRGVYCGAVGWLDTSRCRLDLNVAIRTFTVTGSATILGVGGGVVADSDPAAEWDESELKAARLLEAASLGELVGTPA